MKKAAALLVILFTSCLVATSNWLVDGQTAPVNRTGKRKPTQPKRSSTRPKNPVVQNNSTLGVSLHSLTLDADGNIWAGGSAFLKQGLLLRFDGQRIHPKLLPETWTARQLSFTSPDRGWMLANRHDLFGTTDGGRTWQKSDIKLSPDNPNLETLCFTDPEHGWVGGWRGAIYHTNDGGVSWHRQDSSTKLDIIQMTFVNRLQGWASAWKYGVGSALLATSDGGETWKTVVPNSELLNFTFADNLEGWSIDDRGIVHTVDGGITWSLQRPDDDTNLRLLFFLNNREGWVMGADALLHTADGGKTWTRVNDEDLPFNPEGVLFTDRLHGWAAEGFGDANLFRTSDGGKTWTAVSPGWQSKVTNDVRGALFSRNIPQ